MIENDAALHRCVDAFVQRAERLRATATPSNFIVQAMQGAVARLAGPDESGSVVALHRSE